ncbi:unnamed protein product [Somion occarium]|uniref:DNA 3'-5' helicase n=1 Tax=Somion occarium TaxID=3059160 RepID=A0ABP1DB22_9APHY
MSGPKNNLEDVLRRRQENGMSSLAPASPAPGQRKVSKFKPASTPSSNVAVPKVPSSRPSFSTPGFGRTKPQSVQSAARSTVVDISPHIIQISSNESTPASGSRSAIPAKRPSPDPIRIGETTGSPKRFKPNHSFQKENFFNPSKNKGKARASSRSPFSTPTKSKSRNATGACPKTPPCSRHEDRALPLEYSDLLEAQAQDLQEEYACDLDLKNDMMEVMERYLNEGRCRQTRALIRRMLQLVQDRIDCVRAVQNAKKSNEMPTLPAPSWAKNVAAPRAMELPPLPALPLVQTASSSTMASVSSSDEPLRAPLISEESTVIVDEDDESQFWNDIDELPPDVFTNDALSLLAKPPSTVSSVVVAGPLPTPPPLSRTELQASTLSDDPAKSAYYPEMKRILRNVFRLDSFRPKQLEAITAALSGRDVLVLVPTGGGKSLCFQLPALCRSGSTKGMTVVIGPLIALMEDQINALRAKNIDVIAFHRAEIPDEDVSSGYRKLRSQNGSSCLLYITPERLQMSSTLRSILDDLYQSQQLARFVVDEAHCIAKWGREFRPAYSNLSCLREKYPTVPIMALTATATTNVQKDLVSILGMRNPVRVTDSFNRPNLFYDVRDKVKNVWGEIANFINTKHRGHTGIIYCQSRDRTEEMAKVLRDQYGISAKHYHAKLDSRDKTKVQNEWQRGICKVVVATIAFGMGIDKPDVRFVIHSDVPSSLDSYYQETGRAGRDGKPSDCLMFFSFSGMHIIFRRIREGDGDEEFKDHQEDEYRRVLEYGSNNVECRRAQVLSYFGQNFDPRDCNKQCDNCCDTSSEVYEEDMTSSAKDVLALAHNMTKTTIVNKTLLTKVYRGSKAKDSIMFQNQPHYGAGQKLPVTQVERLINHLFARGYFELVAYGSHDKFTHSKLVVTRRAAGFPGKDEKLIMLFKRPRKNGAPISERRRPPISSHGRNESISVAAPSVASTQQKPSASDGEDDDFVEDDDIIEIDDDDDDFGEVIKAQNTVPRVSGRGAREPVRRSTILDEDPIEIDDEQSQEAGPSRPVLNNEDKIEERCLKELLELRDIIVRNDGSDHVSDLLDDNTLHMLSVLMPNDASSFTQTLKSMGADWKALDKTVAQKFQHICITYRMQRDELANSPGRPAHHAVNLVADLHSRFNFKGP